MTTSSEKKYAVAIREGDTLYPYIWIRRTPKGDVYAITFADPKYDERALHRTHHRDGRTQLVSHGDHQFIVEKQEPDATFRGFETLWGSAIAADHLLRSRKWDPTEYDEVFEIPICSLSAKQEAGRTQLEVDLVEPGQFPLTNADYILWHRRWFTDHVPWIVVSLCDCAYWVKSLSRVEAAPPLAV